MRIILKNLKFFYIILFVFILFCKPVFSEENKDNLQRIFSAGNILGQTYNLLIQSDLQKNPEKLNSVLDRSLDNLVIYSLLIKEPDVKNEYYPLIAQIESDLTLIQEGKKIQDFQKSDLTQDLNNYYSLTKNDFVQKIDASAGWALDLGFYTGFQSASLYITPEPTLLLTGFGKLNNNIPINLPSEMQTTFKNIAVLENGIAEHSKLNEFKENILKLENYLQNYPDNENFSSDLKDYYGNWKGTLLNQYNEKHDFELKLDENNLTFRINKIDGSLPISQIKSSDNYFNFVVTPQNDNKYFIKFDKKLSENILSGDIVSIDGKKCSWAMVNTINNIASEENKALINNYLTQIEKNLKPSAK